MGGRQSKLTSNRRSNKSVHSPAGTNSTVVSRNGSRPSSVRRTSMGDQSKMTVDDFELLKVVGKGSFGKVIQVRKKDTGKIYAMKILKKKQLEIRKQIAHTKTERMILQMIDHPFIVSLRFAFQTKDKLYMVLDFFNGGELFYHLKKDRRFSERRARFYAAEILMALEHLHKSNVVYRDLKPENLLLDSDGNVRLTDFGLSKQIDRDNVTHTFCGTPEYLAPEVLEGKGHGKAVDWWSLGTLLYEMLCGLPPFYNENTNIMYEKILRGRLRFPSYLTREAQDLLTKLLDRDPKTRLGSRGAHELKSHPFFSGMDWDKLYKKELEPPFKPVVRDGDLDTRNIASSFLKETPRDTPVTSSKLDDRASVSATRDAFDNFTFVPEDEFNDLAQSLSEAHMIQEG